MTEFANVSVTIECPHCGKAPQESLARLIGINHMPCPFCGGSINLEVGNNAARIQKLASEIAGLRTDSAKRP
jgi:sarcosine oxidase delta subunit